MPRTTPIVIPAIAPALNDDEDVGEGSDVGAVIISDGLAVVIKVEGEGLGGMMVSHGNRKSMVEMSVVLVASGWVGWDGGTAVCVNVAVEVRGTVNVPAVVGGPSGSVPEVIVMDGSPNLGSDSVVVSTNERETLNSSPVVVDVS